jgi:hypothetical protein
MLTMQIDRITMLLEQASQVEFEQEDDAAETEAEMEPEDENEDVEEDLAALPAYQELTVMLEGLTLEEVYQLLAVAVIGGSDDAEDSWDLAIERAQAVAAEDALAELARILIATDAIESGLGRLGYLPAGDGASEAADEEER